MYLLIEFVTKEIEYTKKYRKRRNAANLGGKKHRNYLIRIQKNIFLRIFILITMLGCLDLFFIENNIPQAEIERKSKKSSSTFIPM